MEVEVKVLTDADGEKTSLISSGNFFETESGFKIDYLTDGDKCALCYDGKRLFQTRRGSVNMDVAFAEKTQTLLKLFMGGSVGEVPVYTNALNIKDDKFGKTIYINYDLNGMRIKLEFSAVRRQGDKNED